LKIFERHEIKRTPKIILLGSGLLLIIAVIIGVSAEFTSIPWLKALRTLELIVRLSFCLAWLLPIFYLVGWLISKQKERVSLVKNLSVFGFSILILFGTVNLLQRLSNRALSPQFDIVEEICRKGFEDPSTLEKYQVDDAVVGSWDYVFVWEDETHNAIWFDSCNSLSSCGVVCVRKGIALKDSSGNYKYREFKYIREGLYWWD
jgi:hypothetical protein